MSQRLKAAYEKAKRELPEVAQNELADLMDAFIAHWRTRYSLEDQDK